MQQLTSRSTHPSSPAKPGYAFMRRPPMGAGKLPDCDMEPLEGFTPRQWGVIAADVTVPVMTWGDQLLHLGWTEQDLFGVNPRVLGSVVRDWGLALLINGGRVVSVSKSVTEIDQPSGARLSFTRN